VTATDLPERFDLASEVPSDDRLAAIRAEFPEVFREDKVDFDALRRSLGDWVEPGPERFGLTWPGKAECMRVIREPSIGALAPMVEDSADWDTTQNVIIEGDNLEVLKLLQKAYYGKVKMIYIDPPYNTGKEFIYPDNFREGLADYLRYSGQADEDGLKLSANVETDGRYHSKWLSMMYPRLFLARNLLREDGVIFVSIDEHEIHHLRGLMNEVFGEENFLAELVWLKGKESGNDSAGFGIHHESVMVFARSTVRGAATIALDAKDTVRHRTDLPEPNLVSGITDVYRAGEPFQLINLSKQKDYEVEIPLTDGSTLSWPSYMPQSRIDEFVGSGRLFVGAKRVAYVKSFLADEAEGTRPGTIVESTWGTTKSGGIELRELFDGDKVFTYPKPSTLIQRFVAITTSESDLVLDFFAGSGPTGQAVMAQNRVDAGQRRFILVQLPEPTGRDDLPSIADITRERVRRAAKQLRTGQREIASTEPDLGFRAYRLTPSNFTVWRSETADASKVAEQLQMAVQHVVDGSSPDALLAELLLKAGYPLTSPLEVLHYGDADVHSVADGALLICLDERLSIDVFENMVELDPAMILVLDSGFGGSDELKVNALQTVRARNQRSGSDITLRVV